MMKRITAKAYWAVTDRVFYLGYTDGRMYCRSIEMSDIVRANTVFCDRALMDNQYYFRELMQVLNSKGLCICLKTYA